MTDATTPVPNPPADPMIRSALYRLLALGFKYPTRETFASFKDGDYLAELKEAASRLPYLGRFVEELEPVARKVREDLRGASFTAFEVKYVSTFDVGFPEPPCPPYQGLYLDRERAKLMVEIAEMYKAFGLAVSQAEDRRELPDYLPALLELMHFLTFKEAQARQEGHPELLEGYVHAQKDFLERHLAGWLPAFAEKVGKQRDLAFFPELATITARFAAAELELVSSMHPALAAARPPDLAPAVDEAPRASA
ncbi:MAG TPA: molecular chaperone TorD family protein [Anaeromyxobacter sp.]|nr:molecular chaperone TorD family protein [Anaeromyxobacter sp.]